MPPGGTTEDENTSHSPFEGGEGGCLCSGLTGSLDKGTPPAAQSHPLEGDFQKRTIHKPTFINQLSGDI